jgi:hypothetical protein
MHRRDMGPNECVDTIQNVLESIFDFWWFFSYPRTNSTILLTPPTQTISKRKLPIYEIVNLCHINYSIYLPILPWCVIIPKIVTLWKEDQSIAVCWEILICFTIHQSDTFSSHKYDNDTIWYRDNWELWKNVFFRNGSRVLQFTFFFICIKIQFSTSPLKPICCFQIGS